jgi:hypothetical protein
MKHCPQCDFIYEDDQNFCDMDGKELVYNQEPVDNQAGIPASLNPTPEGLPVPQSHGVAAAVIVVVVLTALAVTLFLVRRHQTRSGASSEAATQLPERSAGQSPAQSAPENTSAQPAATDAASTQTSDARTGDQSPEQSAESSSSQTDAASSGSQSSPSRASLDHTRLAASPVSAGAPASNNRTSVIVRLNNGAAIKADEAWEKREGIWYRQAGMVTFLKRSRVRTIERLATPAASSKTVAAPGATSKTVAAPAASSKTVAASSDDKSRKNTPAQNPLRLARLEPVDTKKPSRFTSFLKKTGRILKKPFKM